MTVTKVGERIRNDTGYFFDNHKRDLFFLWILVQRHNTKMS